MGSCRACISEAVQRRADSERDSHFEYIQVLISLNQNLLREQAVLLDTMVSTLHVRGSAKRYETGTMPDLN